MQFLKELGVTAVYERVEVMYESPTFCELPII